MTSYAHVPFKDLETKGFVVIRSFLTEAELERCRRDFSDQPLHPTNLNYPVSLASPENTTRLYARFDEVMACVRATTDLQVDCPLEGWYFSTKRGIVFPWHQDSESYFTIQNHYDYLNFYIPIVKPVREKSNLCLIPFDVLEKENPDLYRKTVRSGAARFIRRGRKRVVFFDDTGRVETLGEDISRFAETPHLDAGDLLLMRGDMIHRTQDGDTARVSLSFRAASERTLITRSRLAEGGMQKAIAMVNNTELYERMFRAFDTVKADAIPLGEFKKLMPTIALEKRKNRKEFFRYLLGQKRRERLLLPFFGSALRTAVANQMIRVHERVSRPSAA